MSYTTTITIEEAKDIIDIKIYDIIVENFILDLESPNVTGILPISKGGTNSSTATGSGSVVLQLSPELLGIPTAPTALLGTDSQQLATTEFVQTEKEDTLSKFRSSTKYYVSKTGSDSNSGTSPAEPLLTIKYAVSLSVPGDVIEVEAGTYEEVCPIVVPRDVAIQGDALRRTIIRPTPETNLLGIFKVDSGFYCDGITFAGHQADDLGNVSFAITFNENADNTGIGADSLGAYILKSPYVRNCTSYTAEDDDGLAGSVSTGTTGGGFLIDGSHCANNSPIRSFVVDSYTQINLNGPGGLVRNNGYCQLVSCFGTFCSYHVKCETGGQVNLSNSTTNFGTYGLIADGYSPSPIFTGTLAADAYGIPDVLVRSVFFDNTTNTINSNNHGYALNTKVTFRATDGDLPLEIVSGTVYYVINQTANTFQISETPSGSVLEFTSDGVGTFESKAQGDNSIDITNFTDNEIGPISRPLPGMLMFLNNEPYVVTDSVPITGGYTVSFYNETSGGLKENLSSGTVADFRLRSQIATGGHNMEYVGAGTNYLALPWYGGVPVPENQVQEFNNGKVFFTSTDELGNFKVGSVFNVDGTTGAVTISTDQFNISGLNFIGPFSRNGGFSTVGVQLKEVSDNPNLISSTGSPDGNTVPTQTAVVSYTQDNYLALDGSNSPTEDLNLGGVNITNVGLVDGVDISARDHDAVTVTNSSEIEFTLNNQNITASLITGSIDETKLDVYVNASLDLADSSLQSEDIGVNVQGYSDILENTTASFTTSDETKLDFISVTQVVNLDTIESDVALNNAARHEAVTVTDSNEIDFTLTGQNITASIINGSIDETKLDTLVNASLDLADTSVQPADISEFETSVELDLRDTANRNRSNHTGTQTASTISDFDTEVSNNVDVAANTSLRHDPVTVTDSTEIDFTLTGQNITASIVPGSIDESKLDASVNASLDKADLLYYEPTPVQTSNYSANTNENVLCDTTAGSFTVTLPSSGQVKISDVGGNSQDTGFGINSLTVVPQIGQTIINDSNLILDSGITSITLQLEGTNWIVIDLVVPKIQVIDWDIIVNKPDVAVVNANETITGAYTFSGPLILPNNSRVNGIEHFYQSAKPTTRGDGSALSVGDRWWKIDDGTEWFWNGTYWLSELHEKFLGIGPPSSTGITTLTRVSGVPLPLQQTFLLRDILWSFGSNVGNHDDTTNYWHLYLRSIRGYSAGDHNYLYSYNSNAYTLNPTVLGVHDVYTDFSIIIAPNPSITTWDIAVVKIGSPFTIVGVGVRFRYHLIAP